MPHAVVEYSNGLEPYIDQKAIMQACHNSLLDSGQFGEKDIKVRLYACDYALVAGQGADFIHVTVYMLSGRTDAIKKDIASKLTAAIKCFALPVASLSVDVRDMNREVYSKITS